ncbi:MAG TPA: TonB-dependent siderophore receptor [Methylophilus sp.]|nr:TonB-dependent siderophore receptor [Methylophilus sp.]HQQ34114.1 TonB-dependent siderophore receptor [Methylophilus sp.]
MFSKRILVAVLATLPLLANAEHEGVIHLDQIEVSAPFVYDGYSVTNAKSATKTDTKILETPFSIQVVPRELMDDQQAVTVKDAIKNVSGIVSSAYSYYDFIQLRGFANTQASVYYNSLQLQSIGGLETALLDRIEVVKGPASMLFGRIDPGGLVNLVSKKPQADFAASVQQQIGEDGFFRTTGDVTGKLTEDGKVLYRLVGAYTDADSFMDVVQKRNAVGGAYLTFRPSDAFEFNLRLEGQDYKFVDTEDIGIPIIGKRPIKLSRSTFLGDAVGWDEPNNPKRINVGFDWTYAFNDNWKLTQRFHWDDRNEHQTTLFNNGFDGVATLDRGLWFVDVNRETFATNLDLLGNLDLVGMKHKLLVGIDYYKHRENWNGFSGSTAAVPSINIFNPNNRLISAAALKALPENFFFNTADEWYGLYAQDQISVTEKLDLLVGGRWDWATAGSGESGTSITEARDLLQRNKDQEFSPRVGVLYKVSPTVSTYASYSESFGLNNGRSSTGEVFDPQIAEQYEIGAKYSAPDESLTASIAVFNLEKQNVLTDDLSTADPTDQIAIGKVRNRGIEVDVSGRITSHVSLFAGYAHNDMEITMDNTGLQGNRPRNVPRDLLSIWTKYDSAPGAIEGWQIGLGAYLVGRRFGDDANTWELAGYTTASAMLGYRTKLGNTKLTAQINIDNLFDKEYFDRGGFDAAKYGAPRTAVGSLKLDF